MAQNVSVEVFEASNVLNHVVDNLAGNSISSSKYELNLIVVVHDNQETGSDGSAVDENAVVLHLFVD